MNFSLKKIFLSEAAKSISDLPNDVGVEISKGTFYDGWTIEFVSLNGTDTSLNGKVDVVKPDTPCMGAYVVNFSQAPTGWGPLLYDIAMELAGPAGLTADRNQVSDLAAKVWSFYYKNRNDIKKIPLDSAENPKTNNKNDDCKSDSIKGKSSDAAAALMHVYYASGTPTIDKLKKIKKLVLDGNLTESAESKSINWANVKKTEYVDANIKGQIDRTIVLSVKNEPDSKIAAISFSTVDWEDNKIAHVNFIATNPNWKRMGLAKHLIRLLAKEFGYKNISWGSLTDDGSKLKKFMDKEMDFYIKRGYDMWGKPFLESCIADCVIEEKINKLHNMFFEYYPHDPVPEKPAQGDGVEGEFTALNMNLYHGTSKEFAPGDYILPPKDTGEISEKGRKKNLDKVFFTLDPKSAKIYADRAVKSLGSGTPSVYLVKPIGDIEWLNRNPGTTVLMAPTARVIKKI